MIDEPMFVIVETVDIGGNSPILMFRDSDEVTSLAEAAAQVSDISYGDDVLRVRVFALTGGVEIDIASARERQRIRSEEDRRRGDLEQLAALKAKYPDHA